MIGSKKDKRQKMAEKLRKDVERYRYDQFIDVWAFADTLSPQNDAGEDCAQAWCADDMLRLADLIDPTCENMAKVHPVDGFTCSKCGWSGRVEEDDTDLDEYQKPMFDNFAEFSPRYCPNCGARVVRSDD